MVELCLAAAIACFARAASSSWGRHSANERGWVDIGMVLLALAFLLERL